MAALGRCLCVWLWVVLLFLWFWSMILALVSTATIAPSSGPKCSSPLQAGLDLTCAVPMRPFVPHLPTSYFSK